jgi:hypothetical protein
VLDILVAFLVGRHIASIARRKNRAPVGYVLAFVFAYVFLGLGFGIAGVVLAGEDPANPNNNDLILAVLPGLLIGYALGIAFGYTLVCAVPPVPKRRRRHEDYDDYEDDYDDRPIRRRRDDDDHYDDDDHPHSRRRDDEDDYDRPRRRRDDY